MDDYQRQRMREWSDPVKRADYLRQDAEQVRAVTRSREIKARGRMLAAYAASKATPTRRRRRLPSIYGGR